MYLPGWGWDAVSLTPLHLWYLMMTSSNGEIFSALLAICVGNSPVIGEFPTQRPVTRNFDVFFDLRLNKWLSKQWWGWWFETPLRPLWRHCNFISTTVAAGLTFASSVTVTWQARAMTTQQILKKCIVASKPSAACKSFQFHNVSYITDLSRIWYDDVMIWKCFRITGPLWGGILFTKGQ